MIEIVRLCKPQREMHSNQQRKLCREHAANVGLSVQAARHAKRSTASYSPNAKPEQGPNPQVLTQPRLGISTELKWNARWPNEESGSPNGAWIRQKMCDKNNFAINTSILTSPYAEFG
jgi:hypothetical protein